MGDFIAAVGLGLFVIWLTFTSTFFYIDPTKDLDTLKTKCENNQGIKQIVVSHNKYAITCKDSAKFEIER